MRGRRPWGPLVATLLAGCAAGRGDFPSLATRPEELTSPLAALPDTTTPSPPADATIQSRLADLKQQAAAGAAAFDREIPAVERAATAASGSAVNSENWTLAQQAISRVEGPLTTSAAALADTDRLLADLRLLAATDPNTAGLSEAIATRRAIADAHQQRVDRLNAASARLR